MRLNQEFLKGAEHLTADYCKRRHKLILACDMDETLLTESDKTQNIIMRPKAIYMLRTLRINYELCLITYSTRERAGKILKLRLDPNGKLFGGRVLCREDVMAGFTNKQEALFAHLPQEKSKFGKSSNRNSTTRPAVWPYVVMLDDFPAAWCNVANCIPIRPFLVGSVSSFLVNGRPIPKLLAGECGYVLSVLKFLCKLHSAVFQIKNSLSNDSLDSVPAPIDMKESNSKKITPARANPISVSTAFTVLVNMKRRINSSRRFKNLCYLDPGHFLTFEGSTSLQILMLASHFSMIATQLNKRSYIISPGTTYPD